MDAQPPAPEARTAVVMAVLVVTSIALLTAFSQWEE